MTNRNREFAKLIIMDEHDSDDATIDNNVFCMQNENTILEASSASAYKVPELRNGFYGSNIYRNNTMTSFHRDMPRNFEQQRYLDGARMQRSMINGREMSPMSVRSIPDLQPHNFHYSHGTSQRSMLGGRCLSPMSMRSVSDAASDISVNSIVSAIETTQFNKHELKMIIDKCEQHMRGKVRKRTLKSRNLRRFHRKFEHFGVQGSNSNSSMSSDGCRSVPPEFTKHRYKGHTSTSNASLINYPRSYSRQAMKTDMTRLSQTIRDSNMCTDRTNSFKQHAFQNMFFLKTRNFPKFGIQNSLHTQSVPSSFTSSKSIATIPEEKCRKDEKSQNLLKQKALSSHNINNFYDDTDSSDREQINTAPNLIQNQTEQQKNLTTRPNEFDDMNSMHWRNNSKVDPLKNSHNTFRPIPAVDISSNISTEQDKLIASSKNNDFVFAKPQLPPRILACSKSQDKFYPTSTEPNQSKNQTTLEDQSVLMHSSSDLTKSSFMRRKLFTQTLDVTESKNHNGSDSSPTKSNSPVANIYKSDPARNKTKKSFNSRVSLRKTIHDENQDNNLLELVQKIVPLEHLNTISAPTNTLPLHSDLPNNTCHNDATENTIVNGSEPKWDIYSILSKGNYDPLSDTYTDEEEIFHVKNKPEGIENDRKLHSTCTVTLTNINHKEIKNNVSEQVIKSKKKSVINKNLIEKGINTNKYKRKDDFKTRNRTNIVKNFWDTEDESEPGMHMNKMDTDKSYDDVSSKDSDEELECTDDIQKGSKDKTSSAKRALKTKNSTKSVKSFWDTEDESESEMHINKIGTDKSLDNDLSKDSDKKLECTNVIQKGSKDKTSVVKKGKLFLEKNREVNDTLLKGRNRLRPRRSATLSVSSHNASHGYCTRNSSCSIIQNNTSLTPNTRPVSKNRTKNVKSFWDSQDESELEMHMNKIGTDKCHNDDLSKDSDEKLKGSKNKTSVIKKGKLKKSLEVNDTLLEGRNRLRPRRSATLSVSSHNASHGYCTRNSSRSIIQSNTSLSPNTNCSAQNRSHGHFTRSFSHSMVKKNVSLSPNTSNVKTSITNKRLSTTKTKPKANKKEKTRESKSTQSASTIKKSGGQKKTDNTSLEKDKSTCDGIKKTTRNKNISIISSDMSHDISMYSTRSKSNVIAKNNIVTSNKFVKCNKLSSKNKENKTNTVDMSQGRGKCLPQKINQYNNIILKNSENVNKSKVKCNQDTNSIDNGRKLKPNTHQNIDKVIPKTVSVTEKSNEPGLKSKSLKRKNMAILSPNASIKSFRSVQVSNKYSDNRPSKRTKTDHNIGDFIEPNITMSRSVKNRNGLGFTRVTIGVKPRLCGMCDNDRTDDDTKSMSIYSTASTNLMSRSRKPRFLHIF